MPEFDYINITTQNHMAELAHKLEQPQVDELSGCRDTLKELLARHRINATELAKRIDLPQPTIYRLLAGKTEDPKLSTLSNIADYFSISIDQLLGKVSLDMHGSGQTGISRSLSIPIISWQHAINPTEYIANLNANNYTDWLTIDGDASDSSFGLRSKPSMEPRFHAGSILIVDPKLSPCDGDLVVVYYNGTTEATIRQIVLDGLKQKLQSLVNSSEFEILNEKVSLVGVVIQTRYMFK